MKLDKFDREILRVMQKDATVSMADLSQKVGLSHTPCWRRVKRLEADKIILQKVTLLDSKKLNLGVSIPFTRSDLDKTGVNGETGFYYSVGGGLQYKNIIIDLSYQYNQNKLDGQYSGDVEFSRVTLGIGYRLDI